jgi:hypothetical protein
MTRTKRVQLRPEPHEDVLEKVYCPHCGCGIHIHLDMRGATGEVRFSPRCPNRACPGRDGVRYTVER